MLHENEVVMLLLGLGVFLFILFNRVHIRRIPAGEILLASYSFLLIGWLMTILEGFMLEKVFNLLEHLSYAICAMIMAFWCFKVFSRKSKEGKV